jgi:tRNA dimethylallyltransferase
MIDSPAEIREKSKKPPVLVIAGPTASGKSAFAVALAEAAHGVIINADSLQTYRDLFILTARPDSAGAERVPHRLYGYLDAAERGSAAAWRALALAEVAAATAAGRLPIVVGGTGLYLRALTQGLAPVPDIPEEIRQEAIALHRALGGVRFRERLAALDPAAARRLPAGDTQRLVRAFEVVRATGKPLAAWQARPHEVPPHRFATIRLMPPRDRLYRACNERFAAMIAGGALAEAAALFARRLDPDLPAMKAIGLPELFAHLRGELPLTAAVAAGQRATRHYAKRQITWLRHQSAADLVLTDPWSADTLARAQRLVEGFVLTG